MNDKTNVTPVAAAEPANGKTPAATQKAPPAAPAVSEAVSGKADAAAAPVAQPASSAAPAASEPKAGTMASVTSAEPRDASLWEAIKVGDIVLVSCGRSSNSGELKGVEVGWSWTLLSLVWWLTRV